MIQTDLNFQQQASWDLPNNPQRAGLRFLKIDNDQIYLTIDEFNFIFLCNKLNGELKQRFGSYSHSSDNGKFSNPLGIAIANELLYICDSNNHRVQILNKITGTYESKWGNEKQFSDPHSIYYDQSNNLMYIGDTYSVQIWKSNQCVQKLGENIVGNKPSQFDGVLGISIMNNRLYLLDFANLRIQIFRETQND